MHNNFIDSPLLPFIHLITFLLILSLSSLQNLILNWKRNLKNGRLDKYSLVREFNHFLCLAEKKRQHKKCIAAYEMYCIWLDNCAEVATSMFNPYEKFHANNLFLVRNVVKFNF